MSRFVKDVNQANFATEVIERSRSVPVVVDFWAEWCGPCKQLSPVLERLADEHDGAFELVKIDVDANQALSQQMGVQGIPAVVAFVDGRPVNSFTGAQPEPQVRQWLSTFVGPPVNPAVEAALELLDRGDEAGAEKLLESVLSEGLDLEAGLTLATLYLDQDRTAEAGEVLSTLPPGPEVDQLRSLVSMTEAAGDLDDLAAQLEADPDNADLKIRVAEALAGSGKYDEAFGMLLELITEDEDHREPARLAMVSLFDGLGPDHPHVVEYRRRLANALF